MMNAYAHVSCARRIVRRSIACSRGDGFARATSRRRASCSRTRTRAAPMRSDGSRSTTEISPRRGSRCVPRWSPVAEALDALALLARTRADTAPVTGRAFLALARGDTAGAAAGFEKAATELGDAAPLLLATAARLYAAHHSEQQAIAALERDRRRSRATAPEAPEAELDWARALRQRRTDAGSAIDAPRAPHPHVPAERAPAAGAPRAGAVAQRDRAAELSGARRLTFRMRFWRAARRRFCCAFRRRASAARCSSRWTMSRATTSRRTASRTPRCRRAAQAEWLLNYRGGSFLLPDTPEIRRRAGLDGMSIEPLDDGALNADPRRDGERQHGRRAAREGAEDRDLHRARLAAVGRRRDARAQVRGHRVHADLGRPGRARRAREVRLAPSLPRRLHRAAQQVLHLAIATRRGSSSSRSERWRRRSALGFANMPALKKDVARASARVREQRRVPVRDVRRDGDARARDRRRRTWTSRGVFADGTPMDRDADEKMDWSAPSPSMMRTSSSRRTSAR